MRTVKHVIMLMLSFTLLCGLSLSGQEQTALKTLLAGGDIDAAEQHCMTLTNSEQPGCFKLLGDDCFEKKDFERAAFYYDEGGYREGFDRIGDHYLEQKDFNTALSYYMKGADKSRTARVYGRMADEYRDNGNTPEAKKYYAMAIEGYESLLKTMNFEWTPACDDDWKRCLSARKRFPMTEKEKADEIILGKILRRSANYCDRLRQASIYFFCNEAITETVESSRRRLQKIKTDTSGRFFRDNIKPTNKTRTRAFLYEYQLVREEQDEESTETRILLERNGHKKRVENARLGTIYYRHEKVLYGPIGILSDYWQRFYTFKLLGKEMVDGVEAFVMEAIPILDRYQNTLFGKIWVKAKGYSIIRIQWYPRSSANQLLIKEIARTYGEEPDVMLVSEYGKEVDGICFPSRFYVREAYTNTEGEQSVRLEIDVRYKDYKFFNVQVGEVTYEDEQ